MSSDASLKEIIFIGSVILVLLLDLMYAPRREPEIKTHYDEED